MVPSGLRLCSLRAIPLLAVAAGVLSACTESSTLAPAAPSELPDEKVGRLGVGCPADVQVQSPDGLPAGVTFAAPRTAGGQDPITTQCAPASGSAFDVGTTTVTCTASDALQQSASCSFAVTVRAPPLELSCPAPVQAQSFDGRPVVVAFDSPRPAGGQPPVATRCTPASGSAFDVGTTNVECTASDASGQSASCAFTVTVLGPPMLMVTTFLAFGDSLTAGEVAAPVARTVLEPASSYPWQLQRALQARYGAQQIRVVNAGVPGEQASDAVGRFRTELLEHSPGVVLLMEGANDLDLTAGAGAESAAAALESMAATALANDVDVLLMTIPPQRDRAEAAMVEPLNRRIRSIARQQGAVLVDIHDVLLRARCSGAGSIPCIGHDGLHPTREGYRLIAEELAGVIRDLYDTASRSATTGVFGSSQRPSFSRAPMRTAPRLRVR